MFPRRAAGVTLVELLVVVITESGRLIYTRELY